ncbi:transcriptional regulator LsrR [Vibrio panuliri]|uniref:Transcriptional regulator LsrR n=2 Tax=Vibrio panuliri TaxID=1381081 RepID=A0ABX3FBA4_9VIBR|nr:transcriptional regulator LsrR [Vibrio panuliri]OLQ88950.1 transcriptional regulator LsrR [Vibrio panuliri]
MSEEELLARIAWFYYNDNLTQAEIGNLLGMPRLKVSRLLEKGRQQGLIHVRIHSRYEGCLDLEQKLKQQFSLNDVRVIPDTDPTGVDINHRVSVGAASMVVSKVKPNDYLAIGFGETIMATLKNLGSFLQTNQVPVVSLAGGVGTYMKGISHLDASCDVSLVPAPLRVSSKKVADVLYQEASVNDVLMASCSADVAVISLGSIAQVEKATMHQTGYISLGEQKVLQRRGAQGDILGYFFDQNGEVLDGVKLHEELIAIRPERLRDIPLVIGVAGGTVKAEAILAALKGQYINVLVTNEAAARKILELTGKLE